MQWNEKIQFKTCARTLFESLQNKFWHYSCHLQLQMPCYNLNWTRQIHQPFNSQVKFVILLIVNHKILVWELSIRSTNCLQIDIFLYSQHLSGWYNNNNNNKIITLFIWPSYPLLKVLYNNTKSYIINKNLQIFNHILIWCLNINKIHTEKKRKSKLKLAISYYMMLRHS